MTKQVEDCISFSYIVHFILRCKNVSKNLRKDSEALRGVKAGKNGISRKHDHQQAIPGFRMNVLFLTIFISTVLALFFVGAFLYHHDFSGGDALRDSLLPFQKEQKEKSRTPESDKKVKETKGA